MYENILSLCKVLNLEKSKNMSDKRRGKNRNISFDMWFLVPGRDVFINSPLVSSQIGVTLWCGCQWCCVIYKLPHVFPLSAVMLELTEIPSYCDSQEQWPSLLAPTSPLRIPAGCYRLRWVAGDRSVDVVAVSGHLLMVGWQLLGHCHPLHRGIIKRSSLHWAVLFDDVDLKGQIDYFLKSKTFGAFTKYCL